MLKGIHEATPSAGSSHAGPKPQAEVPKDFAERMLKESKGNMDEALKQIVLRAPSYNSMRPDVAEMRNELAAMIEHSPEFQKHLGMPNAESLNSPPANLLNGSSRVFITQIWAHVATLSIDKKHVQYALAQLDVWANRRSGRDDPNHVTSFQTSVILTANLAAMPEELQHRAAQFTLSLLEKLPPDRVLPQDAASQLPQSSSGPVAELRTRIERAR